MRRSATAYVPSAGKIFPRHQTARAAMKGASITMADRQNSTAATKKANWHAMRGKVKDWSRPALISLLKDLYDASPDNRNFIHARFEAEDGSGAVLEKYRRKIVEQFFPARGFGKLRLGEARKAIKDYRKATNNLGGTIDLMLTYVENGTEFTCQFGDIDAPFYKSLESVLDELSKLFLGEGREFYPKFRDRVLKFSAQSDNIGWGYGDFLFDTVNELEAELMDEVPKVKDSVPEA